MNASEIRGLLSQIDSLAPRLNDATVEAGEAVREIEAFLAERRVSVACCLVIMGGEDKGAVHLLYQRCRDNFHIAVRVRNLPAMGMPDDMLVPWSECPRHIMMLTFPHIPELLRTIVDGLSSEIEKTRSTTRLAKEMMTAVQPGPVDPRHVSALSS